MTAMKYLYKYQRTILSLMIIERMPRMAVTQVIQRIINDTQISNSFVGVNYQFLMSELYCIIL